MPLAVPDKNLAPDGESSARLLQIRIERWGEVRFSGLLALRQRGEGLYYILLDATGVKLLEVAVDGAGEYRLIHAKGGLQDSALGGFLAEVLIRTYGQEPATLPCAGTWLYQLCREENTGNGWRKYGQVGPLQLWQVVADPGHAANAAVIYRQPWLGVRIFLAPTKEDTKKG